MGERLKSRRLLPSTARSRYVLVAGLAVCATALAFWELAGGTGRARSASPPSFTVGTKGRLIQLTQQQERRLSGAPSAGTLSLLAIRDGRAFYRLGDPRARCYAVGDARTVGTVGAVSCWDDSQPLMDFSVVDLSSGVLGETKFFRIEGIAADQVSSVGLLSSRGDVIARVPVAGNVYAMPVPPDDSVRALVALDSRGRTLGTLSGP
jgi:hypothetical protein